ncbi:MAG: DUF1206 domain-containing protein [Bacteriovoracaceae bacterium]|nr:DUF1206 domain-containing protein [Bacteriovoracaceae bacterium]
MIVQAILLIIIVILAKPLLMKCSSQIDVWIYGATSLYYIAMEVINYGKYKKGSEEEMKIYADKDKDEQIEAMNSAYEETNEAAEAAHKKAGFAKNTMVGFALAVVILGIRMMLSAWTSFGTMSDLYCNGNDGSGGEDGGNTGEGTESAGDGVNANPDVVPVNIFDNKYYNMSNNETEHEEVLNPGVSLVCSADDSNFLMFEKDIKQSDKNQIYLRDQALQAKYLQLMREAKTDDEREKLKNVMSYFVSDATADGGVLAGLGIGVVALVVIQLLAKSFGKMIEGWMNSPWGRLIAYAAFGLIALAVWKIVEAAAEELDERADQYKNLAEQLTQQLNGFQIAAGGGFSNINRGDGPESSIEDEKTTTKVENCFTGKPGSLKQDPQCLCKKSNNCKRMEMPKVSFNGMTTPGIVSEPMSLFQDSGNKLYNGDLSGANASGAKIGQYALKARNAQRRMFDKLNNKRVNKGLKPVQFDKRINSARAKLSKMFNKTYNTLTPEQKSSLANFSPTMDDKTKDKFVDKNKGAIAAGKKSSSRGGKGKPKDAFAGFDFGDDEESSTEEVGLDPDAVAANMADEGMFQGDITDRPDENIFKIITTRYMKSAYPAFFDDEEGGGAAPPNKISE